MPERAALRQDIIALMQPDLPPVPDDAFNHLARRVFQFQFNNNTPYRRFCERRGVSPDVVQTWLDIAAVPTAAFKAAALVSGNIDDAEAVFRTSGTTQGEEKRGTHYVLDVEMYRTSLLPTFRCFVMPDFDTMPIVSLIPPWQPGGESSLGFMATEVIKMLGTADSMNAIGDRGIDYDHLHKWVQSAKQPVCILGTSLAFVHWFDELERTNQRFSLPARSRVMDTGGFKGSQRAITSAELRAKYSELLGIEPRYVVNEYGMTELLSQFYDAHLRSSGLDNLKQGPPWIRSAVVDPETLKPLANNDVGLLRHFDLANVFSVSAIQTEDLGRMRDGGFELLGRVAGAAPRGCSIAMDLFLSSVRA